MSWDRSITLHLRASQKTRATEPNRKRASATARITSLGLMAGDRRSRCGVAWYPTTPRGPLHLYRSSTSRGRWRAARAFQPDRRRQFTADQKGRIVREDRARSTSRAGYRAMGWWPGRNRLPATNRPGGRGTSPGVPGNARSPRGDWVGIAAIQRWRTAYAYVSISVSVSLLTGAIATSVIDVVGR